MVISEVVTLFLYAISIAFLPEYFGKPSSPIVRSIFSTYGHIRSIICCDDTLCMESRCHSGDQCDATVDHQTHTEQSETVGIEQVVIILSDRRDVFYVLC